MPTVTPWRGTSSRPPNVGNVARLSRRVCSASGTTWVRVETAVPGGLKAMCPSPAPEARMNRSMPPRPAIRLSYSSGSAGSGTQSRSRSIPRPAPHRLIEPLHDLHQPEAEARVGQRRVDAPEAARGLVALQVLVHHDDRDVTQVQGASGAPRRRARGRCDRALRPPGQPRAYGRPSWAASPISSAISAARARPRASGSSNTIGDTRTRSAPLHTSYAREASLGRLV